jgi:prepilin-type processing-associated H-X9-DG protein
MTGPRSRLHRRGLTLIDALAATAMCGIAACMLLPAMLESRQSSDVNVCTQNLQTLGKSFLAFERAQGGLPPRRTGGGFGNTPFGGWGAQILPHLNEKLGGEYHRDYDYFDPINKKVVETKIAEFICPAAPPDRQVLIRSNASAASVNPSKDVLFETVCGANDYIASNGFNMPRSGYGVGWPDGGGLGNQRQAMSDTDNRPLTDITDGLSCTILVIEKAGGPASWRMGKKIGDDSLFAGQNISRGTWAGYGSIAFGPMNPNSPDDPLRSGRGDSTDCSVNCNNTFGIYGFHEKGANILLCDGAVRFVSTKLDGLTFGRLTTRDDGQLLSDDAF